MKENILAHIENLRKSRLKQAEDFYREKLTAEEIAASFGLSPEQISDEDLAEIQEFALNAGLEMVANRNPENTISDFAAYHDIFHAAERMRVSKGHNATPKFITRDNAGSLIAPEVIIEEFYPALFFSADAFLDIFDQNISQLIYDPRSAQDLFDVYKDSRRNLQGIDLTQFTPLERYEVFLKLFIENDTIDELIELEREDLIPEFLENLDQVFNSPERPAHYTEFAQRVFDGEWQENPRLFLDQFLSDIRTLS